MLKYASSEPLVSYNLFAGGGFEIFWELPGLTQRYEGSKCSWKNGAERLIQCSVATDLQFLKNTVSVKHNEVKCNKTKYVCTEIQV